MNKSILFRISLLLLAVAGCTAVALAASKSNPKSEKTVSKNYSLAAFDKISQEWIADVIVTQGNKLTVSAKGTTSELDELMLSVSDGQLKITRDGKNNMPRRRSDLKVFITMPHLTKILSTGTGDIDIKGTFSEKSLKIVSNGTGDIKIPSFIGETLHVVLNGTGDIEAGGSATTLDVIGNGTGDGKLTFNGLKNLSIAVNGSGDFDVIGSTESAVYSVSGAGDIKAGKMTAQSVEASVTGAGDIVCYSSGIFSSTRTGIGKITCLGKNKQVR